MVSSQQPKRRDAALPTLDVFIQVLNVAQDTCGIPPVQAALGEASALLAMIRDTMAYDQNYVDLGRACGDVCNRLQRGLIGTRLDQLNQPVLDAIGDLTEMITGIQRNIVKHGKRRMVSRFILAKSDKDKIAGWKQDLARVLRVFHTELAINTNMTVADAHTMIPYSHRGLLTVQEGPCDQNNSIQPSIPLGESPPPAPRDCFGRDELIEQVVELAENLKPIALIGAGGIGKTSIALTFLHHSRIKERFGDNRRFIRCDQLPASLANFLARLSRVVGAGVENPEDLGSLRPFLSSKVMLIILDNAESILDPQGPDAREIYSIVDELCWFPTISLLITSRITTVPPHCKRLEIPTLTMEAACDIFYNVYGDGGRSSIVNDILQRLDFHALSIILLATVAAHNGWDSDRLASEWETKRAQVLQTNYNVSLTATIELSLGSPTFRKLDPLARGLLGIVAFFPRGVDEKNLDWLFPTISNRKIIFDKFCILSLTYRSNGFVTMLAPVRDYLGPRDPRASPLLRKIRDRYLIRLSVDVSPGNPGFEEAQWVASEDVNVEHLLDVFTSIDPHGDVIWDACFHFMNHLYWHKPRLTVLQSKIEALPDDHHSKPKCLSELSQLFNKVGNHAERIRLLINTLELQRQRGDDFQVALTLQYLSDVNRHLEFHEEGIGQAMEALEIFERIDNTIGQTQCLNQLAWLLFDNKQLDAAESAASRAIDLVQEEGQEFIICQLHQILGDIYGSKGEEENAIHHFEAVLAIASPFNWHNMLFWTHHALVELFLHRGELDGVNTHFEQVKSHTAHEPYNLGRTIQLQANIWYLQDRFEDAKSEALCALEIYEQSGAAVDAKICRKLLQAVEQALENQPTSSQDELLESIYPTLVKSHSLV